MKQYPPRPGDLCLYERAGVYVRVLHAYSEHFPDLFHVEVLEAKLALCLGQILTLPGSMLRRAQLDPELCAEMRAIASMKVRLA